MCELKCVFVISYVRVMVFLCVLRCVYVCVLRCIYASELVGVPMLRYVCAYSWACVDARA